MAAKQENLTDIIFEYAAFGNKNPNWRIRFAAFINAMQDNYVQRWNSTEVYGKPDSIETYQNTRRNISLSWDVPSSGPMEGYANMMKIDAFVRMLYPVYESRGKGIRTIQRPPLLRLKFDKLIQNHNKKGLLGHVQGFNFKPDFANGVYNFRDKRQFGPNLAYGSPGGQQNIGPDFIKNILGADVEDAGLVPKSFSMQCQFVVLHEHELGFGEDAKFLTNQFPYSSMKKAGSKELEALYGFKTSGTPGAKANIPNPNLTEIEYAKILQEQKKKNQ